jgi:type I restriction enzyme S subunit
MKGDELPVDGYPRTSPEIEKSYVCSRLERGDLVIAIRATVGNCLPVPDELIGANLTQGTAKISPGQGPNEIS